MVEEIGGNAAKQILKRVRKTEVLKQIDELSKDRGALRKVVSDLREKSTAPLLEIGALHRCVDGDHERKQHLQEHWLADQHSEAVLREALLTAGERALELNLPTDSYWIFAGDRFEVAICESSQQITLLIVAPFPAGIRTEGEAPPQQGIQLFR